MVSYLYLRLDINKLEVSKMLQLFTAFTPARKIHWPVHRNITSHRNMTLSKPTEMEIWYSATSAGRTLWFVQITMVRIHPDAL